MRIVYASIFLLINVAASLGCDALDFGVFIEPCVGQFTSETLPFSVVFTNKCNKTLSIPYPIIGKNLCVRVYDKKGEELARSGILSQCLFRGGDRNIVLSPQTIRKTEIYNLFDTVRPVFRIIPNQVVKVEVVYVVNGKEHVSQDFFNIPPHDEKVKPGYISKENAYEIAEGLLKKQSESWQEIENIRPEISYINGSYRIRYVKPIPEGVLCDDVVVSIKVDAKTGKVLQIQGPGD